MIGLGEVDEGKRRAINVPVMSTQSQSTSSTRGASATSLHAWALPATRAASTADRWCRPRATSSSRLVWWSVISARIWLGGRKGLRLRVHGLGFKAQSVGSRVLPRHGGPAYRTEKVSSPLVSLRAQTYGCNQASAHHVIKHLPIM